MIYSKSGLALTEQFEGCKLNAYLDSVGVPTIGYGHTRGVKLGDTCTWDQAYQWLKEDIQWSSDIVNKMVIVPLTQQEFDAIVDLVYNIGSGNFEKSTILKLLNQSNYIDAANEFDKWDKAGGNIVAGLLRRRQAETSEFQQGLS